MKRVGFLYEQITERDNLRLGYYKALRGKRDRAETRRFGQGLEEKLAAMGQQLRAGTFPLGRFSQFVIHDPKERIITAPCFAERVLHHAILNVCEPYFERWLIADSFACRRGKGRVAALQRTQQFAGQHDFFLKLDIRKYFDRIVHERLLHGLGRHFKDDRLLALFQQILHSYRGSMGRGIPIGSLTSQHFANFYLGRLDHFLKEHLRISGYVRYMDDMALWSNSVGRLQESLAVIATFLHEELELQLKPEPYWNRTDHGMEFLGCRVYRRHMTLSRRSRCRFRRKLTRLELDFQAGLISAGELQRRAEALQAFTRAAGVKSWQFRRTVIERLPVSGHRARTG
jgi:hypothetical protein